MIGAWKIVRWFIATLVGVALMVALAGCGGAGTQGAGPTRQTRDRVQGIHQLSLRSLGFSGFGSPGLLGSWGEPGTTGGAGGGPASPGVPMLGAFVRSFATGSIGRTRDGGTSGGGGGSPPGPDPWPEFYYDGYLDLWVQTVETPTSYQCLFFEDEAKTLPAGSMETTWPGDWNTYPQTFHTQYQILAGSLRGAHGQFECVTTSESAGNLTYENVNGDGSHDTGTSEWSDQAYIWNSRWDASDGSWCTDSGEFSADGSGHTLSEDSLGYRLSYTYRADGSGYGRIEGPDPGLPAVVTWDVEGNMRIVYSDGTVETYPGYGWGEPGEGGGTGGSGEGGGGSGGPGG